MMRRIVYAAFLLVFSLEGIQVVPDARPVHAQSTMCAIDMGSNTFRRIVGRFASGRYEQTAIDKQTVGVGDDVASHGRISAAKLDEIDRVLASFKASCSKDGVAQVKAIGTAAFRDAPNGAQVVARAAKLGIPMEIASEQRESELAYLVGSLGRDGYAVIDNGSRSIELVAGNVGAPQYLVFNLGYRVAYDGFFADATDPAAAVSAFRQRLERHLPAASFMKGRKALVGVEFAEMATVLFNVESVEGQTISVARLEQRLGEIAALDARAFQRLKRQKDVDRALPRLVAAAVLTRAFGYTSIELTERELGTGLVIEAGLKR
jgi:exopolyphosphatase/pppGpp-phosphohydrolase